jgi:lipopolysaccharide/colanic/teichoic acid biosynthesis glycosyltransferase
MPFETLATDSCKSSIASQNSIAGFYARKGKRILDVTLSALLLLAFFPLLLLISIVAKISSPGSIFYLQDRVGQGGRVFKIIKFRSMVVGADRKGPGITCTGDARVTWIGRILRHLKLDELPQLWNVLKGDMSLVGPRPELPVYVASYNQRQRAVLSVRPGITDAASIAYRWEERLLSESPEPETFYRELVLPQKLDLNLSYITTMSLGYDLRLLLRTASSLLRSETKISK